VILFLNNKNSNLCPLRIWIWVVGLYIHFPNQMSLAHFSYVMYLAKTFLMPYFSLAMHKLLVWLYAWLISCRYRFYESTPSKYYSWFIFTSEYYSISVVVIDVCAERLAYSIALSHQINTFLWLF
jgi:hypothetical protein